MEERSAKDSARLARAREHEQKKPQQQAPRAPRFGGFAALADSSDDDERLLNAKKVSQKPTPKEDFPSLVQAKPAPNPVQVGNSWAARVTMAPEPKPAEPNAGMVVISDCFTGKQLELKESVFTKAMGLNQGVNVGAFEHDTNKFVRAFPATMRTHVARKSWADWSDSEDEDEDQQQEATDAW
jgi:hypothetical protein